MIFLFTIFFSGLICNSVFAFRLEVDFGSALHGTELEGEQVIEGSIYLPLRSLSDFLGYDVDWTADTKTINIKDSTSIYALQIGNKKVSKLDRSTNEVTFIIIDKCPCIINDSTYIPLRAFGEMADFDVEWDAETKTVFLYKTKPLSDKCGDTVFWDISDYTLYLRGYGTTWNYNYGEKKAFSTDIAGEHFKEGQGPDAKYITVIVGEDITSIGDYMFEDCFFIGSVYLPNGLEYIGECAFAYNDIETIEIPSSVTYIGNNAFFANDLKTVYCEKGSYADNPLLYPEGVSIVYK